MKRILILLALLTSLVGAAENPPWRIEVQILRLAAGTALGPDRLLEMNEYEKLARSGQVLESGMPLGLTGDVMMGSKVPVTYFDPRAGAPQVNYVDSGFKVDTQTTILGDRARIECFVSQVSITPDTNLPLSPQDGFKSYSSLLLRPGQVALASTTRGKLTAQYLRGCYPQVSFHENDTLIVAVLLHR